MRGICGVMIGNRSEFAVAALAVWRAGKALVLIDPNWPDRRIGQVASLLALDCIVTIEAHHSRAEAIVGADKVLTVDLEEIARAERPALAPVKISNDETAYIIFTSGSTGRPKGVPITHANLAQLLAWQEEAFALSARYRSLQVLPVSFDFGFEEVLNQLCFGGSVVFADPGEGLDPDLFATKARAVGADLLYVTPTQLDRLLPALDLRPFRMILVGGETFPWTLWDKLAPFLDDKRLVYNGYGPTEATITATAHRLRSTDRVRYAGALSVPIGQPCAQCRIEILDDNGQPRPPGVIGKIVIGGGGVSPGYIGTSPEQGARFAPDPREAGATVFHTGDLARRHEDGTIEFLGREDGQIKVAGFRVELEEIADVLRRAGARRVVVDYDSQRPGAPLVAYAVTSGAAGLRSLYDAVSTELPVYARPRIVPVEYIPETVNGKADLAALRRFALAETRRVGEAKSGEGPVGAVTQVWRDLLGTELLGPEDDVFNFGANSLLLIRAKAALKANAGLSLSLPDLFVHRTPHAQATRQTREPEASGARRATARDPRSGFAAMRQRRRAVTGAHRDG